MHSSNPIIYLTKDEDIEETGYYFWDECWIKVIGPFNTIEECKVMLYNYATSL